MTPDIIVSLIQYAIKYGIPAVLELINTFKAENVTWDQVQAAFKVAETPYGLTPQIVTPPTPPTPATPAPAAPTPA